MTSEAALCRGGVSERTRHVDLWIARGLTLGPVVLAFPVSTLAVFAWGADRSRTADVLAVIYSVGLFAACTTSLWPLPSLRSWSRFQRIASLCLLFMVVSYATHLTWELGWLVLHESIQASRDAAWAYPWWAYIDGGDLRYAGSSSTLLTMEALSVLNGAVGVVGLSLWYRSRHTDPRGLLLCMATAVVHLYSTSLYFGGEILDGLPNVDTSSFLDAWFKFGLANAPWIVFPWFVLYWGQRTLRDLSGRTAEKARP
ncbi:MAG: emopamil-binding family protein [Myxococcota bacterium]